MNKLHNAIRKIHYNSPVVLTFALVSLAALLLAMATGGTTASWVSGHLFSVGRTSLLDPLTYVRLFGHVIGHINFQHYINNFLLILVVGPMLEEKYGSKSLLVMIAFTAAVTGIITMVFVPNVMLMGASGIAFMMILLSSFVNLKKGTIPLTLILCAVLFIGMEVLRMAGEQTNIANYAHIIGGLCGALFGYVINKNKITGDED